MKINRFNKITYPTYILSCKYWEIKTEEPYLEASLNYLESEYDCDIKLDDLIDPNNQYGEFDINNDEIYISLQDGDIWNYSSDLDFLKYFDNVTFMGKLNFTDEEIDLMKQTKKYNL